MRVYPIETIRKVAEQVMNLCSEEERGNQNILDIVNNYDTYNPMIKGKLAFTLEELDALVVGYLCVNCGNEPISHWTNHGNNIYQQFKELSYLLENTL